MYENQTYDTILARMLSRVPNDMDRRESSVIYQALAPAALELAQMYSGLNEVLNETFADTASRFYLLKRGKERGLYPNPATYAVVRAEIDAEIPSGFRLACNNINYTMTSSLSSEDSHFLYELTCETPGEIGNQSYGDLIPLDRTVSITSARILEIIIHGEEAETTEDFRIRYFADITNQAFGGNRADYLNYMRSLPDVGGSRIYPVWNGGGSVKIVFTDSTFNVPNAGLVAAVQQQIDPIENAGRGSGLAPIGHTVTVEAATEETINISVDCLFMHGYTWDDVKVEISQIVQEYLSELNRAWGDSGGDEDNDRTGIIVRVSQIERRILDVAGIADVTSTKINGGSQNHQISDNSIVKLGGVQYETSS
jgi:uncharacterized phage protein gp47/JayE|nr:MAG TPA: Baseplate J like protein [Caudoviricetes sp.]